MADLKFGGSDVKIMYGDREIGGATKLEPGTILYMSEKSESDIKNLHLLSTTKNWNNLNGINVGAYIDNFSQKLVDANITGDDFKNSDIIKSIKYGHFLMNISISIVDGEYRLNVKPTSAFSLMVKAI